MKKGEKKKVRENRWKRSRELKKGERETEDAGADK